MFDITIRGATIDEFKDKVVALAHILSAGGTGNMLVTAGELVTTGKGGKKGTKAADAAPAASAVTEEATRAAGSTGTVVPATAAVEEDDGLDEEPVVTHDDVKPLLVELKGTKKFSDTMTIGTFINGVTGAAKLGEVPAEKLGALLAATKAKLAELS